MITMIRKATAKDTNKIKKIIINILKTNQNKFRTNTNYQIAISADQLTQQFLTNLSNSDLLICGKKIIGISIYTEDQIDIMMSKDFLFRKNCGLCLLKYAEQKLFENYPKIFLENFNDTKKTKSFFQKYGWRELKHIFDTNWGVTKSVYSKFKQSPVRSILDSLDFPHTAI